MKKGIIISVLIPCLILEGCSISKKIIVPGDKDQNNIDSSQIKDIEGLEDDVKEQSNPVSLRPVPRPQIKPESENQPPKETTSFPKGYLVQVSVTDQEVHVYKDGSPVKTMICSTGVDGKDTPLGNYKINHRGTWFFSRKFNQGGKYWVGFIGKEYLFHSVPADEEGRIIEDEAEKLGIPASHGCIRLSLEDAKWFYKTIPDGSNVVIEK